MRLIHKLSGKGFEALTEEEIKSLLHEIMFTPTYMGHLAPLLKAELDARRSAASNKHTFYISILALIVSIASFVKDWL